MLPPHLTDVAWTRGLASLHGRALGFRVYRPRATPARGTVVFFHGGGWTLGDLDSHHGHCQRLATQTRSIVVGVDYRRAPEAPFPAAFFDAYDITGWVFEHLHDFGGANSGLVVAGESSGAQLAASAAVACRDAGIPIAAQLLLYPPTDARGSYVDEVANSSYPSRTAFAEGPALTLSALGWFASLYLGDSSGDDWRVSPLLSTLKGLGPTIIHRGGFDLLGSEIDSFAAALGAQCCTVIYRIFGSLTHGYFGLGGVSAAAESAASKAASDLVGLIDRRS